MDDEALRARLSANFDTLETFASAWQAYARQRHSALAAFVSDRACAAPLEFDELLLRPAEVTR
jgi:hypothetical protein